MNVTPVNFRVQSGKFLDFFLKSNIPTLPATIKAAVPAAVSAIKKNEANIKIISPSGQLLSKPIAQPKPQPEGEKVKPREVGPVIAQYFIPGKHPSP